MLSEWQFPLARQLSQLALHQQLHHALLLSGRAGVGKLTLAQYLAQHLLCVQPTEQGGCGQCKSCLLFKAGHHPDLLHLQSENSLGVDAIRQLSQFMQSSPQQGGARVVLLPHAHHMTEAAANALLKTLEEPGENSFLLLLSEHEQQLLPTILSRCQRWFISAVAASETLTWLKTQFDGEIPEFLPDYCEGAPLRALALLQSGEAHQIAQTLAQLELFFQQQFSLQALVKQLESQPERVAIVYWWVEQYVKQQNAMHVRPQLFHRLAQWCRDEQQILGQNKTLALTALLLDMQRLLR